MPKYIARRTAKSAVLVPFSRSPSSSLKPKKDSSTSAIKTTAATVVSGPTDLFFNETYRPEMRKHFQKMFGGSREEKKKRSVLYWYKKIPRTVPLLVLCGMADWRVDPREAFRFAEKATGHFRDFKLIAYPRGTHELEEYETQVNQEIVNWFNTFLN